MTETEYILQEVSAQRENAEQVLCYGPVHGEAQMRELRGALKVLKSIEVFIADYEQRKRED